MRSIPSTPMSSSAAIRHAGRSLLVLSMIAAAACATGPQFSRLEEPRSDAAVLLLPGDGTLAVSALHEQTIAYQVVQDSGSERSARRVGGGRIEIRSATYAGKPALLVVMRSNRGAMQFFDSALVRRADLTPVWEVSDFRGSHRRFEYDGARVRFVGRSGDSTLRGDHTYRHRIFQFNELDLLVRTIPLVPGYRAVVPLYSEGSDALEMDTISIARSHADGPWDVRFSDPVIVSHYGIDPATRSIVSRVITRQDGSPIRLHYAFEAATAR